MLMLYSYPELFGVADNNGYGLKVFAFLKLTGVPFVHEHIFDASGAPRGQLPYIVDDGETIGDSETIIAHLIRKYRLTMDAALSPAERMTDHLISRMLDNLYWVMSYSRWKDDRYFPAFRDAFMTQHSRVDAAGLDKARKYNEQRSRCCLRARPGRPEGAVRSDTRERLCAWGKADQHRCRHLRIHRQHPLFSDRDAAQGFRHGPSESGAPLRRYSRGRQRVRAGAARRFSPLMASANRFCLR
jgi:Glutathione S-transferase N-terminal domain